MSTEQAASPEPGSESQRSIARIALVALFYLAAAAVATYPRIAHLTTELPPGGHDPMIHLWIMRWYRTCLLEGRLPFLSPELLHPLGTPLGYLPPMQIQSAAFLLLSLLTSNDILNFNIIWFTALVTSGLGVYFLACHLLQDRRAAALSGLLAMLSGPVLFLGQGELEHVTLFAFPVFLLAWMKLVDSPSQRKLLAAVGMYTLLAASGPYPAILALVPAVLYVLDAMRRAGRAELLAWTRSRLGWFAGFSALLFLIMPVLFMNQVWSLAHGFPVRRSDAEFNAFSASIWTYLFPWSPHQLMRLVVPNFSTVEGVAGRVPSYLGVITLALVGYAGVRKTPFRRAGYWWTTFAALVILSLGAFWTVGTFKIPLPAYWLRHYGLILQPLRVPGRFNLAAAIFAAILAGAGYKSLLAAVRRPRQRALLGASIAILAVADLAIVPYGGVKLPPTPSFYREILTRKPDATILEAPYPNHRIDFLTTCAVWQSEHRARTSSGYTAVDFHRLANLTNFNSPFDAGRLADASYLLDPEHENFDLERDVRFDDYAWLYLTAHGFDFVALHKRPQAYHAPPLAIDRLKARLEAARVHEDDGVVVYSRALMSRPTRPVTLCLSGWRERVSVRQRRLAIVERQASLAVFNPDATTPITIELEASGYRRPRQVRLREGARILARWSVTADDPQRLVSPPLTLSEGLHNLVLESDGEDQPAKPSHAPVPGDRRPFSLWVAGLRTFVDPSAELSRAGHSQTR